MPVDENGWNSDWNKPDSELTASERRAIQDHTTNAMWAARLARTQQARPVPGRTGRPTAQETYEAAERQRAAEQKRIRERNQTRFLVVGLAIILSIFSLVLGMWLHNADPSSQLAGVLATIGTIGCILAVPMIMLAGILKE